MAQLKDIIHLYLGCKVLIDEKEVGTLLGGNFLPNSINQVYYDIRTSEMVKNEDLDFMMPYNDDYGPNLRIKPFLRPLSVFNSLLEKELITVEDADACETWFTLTEKATGTTPLINKHK